MSCIHLQNQNQEGKKVFWLSEQKLLIPRTGEKGANAQSLHTDSNPENGGKLLQNVSNVTHCYIV
jgi:hypothetical protein